MLAVHLLALSNEIATLDESVQGSVSRSTLELLGIALSGQQPSATFDASAAMLRRVQDFILQHLHEDDLSPTRIAEANHISLRYLHMLFQRSDMTVLGWVLDRRLDACKQALADPAYNRQRISEIAFRWGFNQQAISAACLRRSTVPLRATYAGPWALALRMSGCDKEGGWSIRSGFFHPMLARAYT